MSKVSLYNRGRRSWSIEDFKEQVNLEPGGTVTVEQKTAEKYEKLYPTEFVIGGAPSNGGGVKALKAEIKGLRAELERLKAENAELTAKLDEAISEKKSKPAKKDGE